MLITEARRGVVRYAPTKDWERGGGASSCVNFFVERV